jgi:hypothetical protein
MKRRSLVVAVVVSISFLPAFFSIAQQTNILPDGAKYVGNVGGFGDGKCNGQAITPDLARAAFDHLWQAFDRDYAMFVLRPEVDWTKLREQYRPRAIAATSTREFAQICAQMLKQLRDEHVWLTLAGDYVPVFNLPKHGNSNPSAYPAILGNMHNEGAVVKWAVTDDKVGFIAIYGWNDSDVPDRCQSALEHMRDTRGLIVDVRMNYGGNEEEAMSFAGRFIANVFTYAYDQVRNGPNHTDLTAKIPGKIAPVGPWRYDRPVILLIGQICESSDESFIDMMTGDPLVTTMGDHTAGASGKTSLFLKAAVAEHEWILRASLNASATELSGIWKEGGAPYPIAFARRSP